MKKLITFCLILACIVQLAACQQPADGGEEVSSQGSTTTTTSMTDSTDSTDGVHTDATTSLTENPGLTTETMLPHESDVTAPSSTTTLSEDDPSTPATTTTGGQGPAVTTTTQKTTIKPSKSSNANGNASVSSGQTSKPTTKPTTVADHKHQWKSKTIVPAGCTMKGYTQYNCACGYSEKSDYIDPLGHVYGNWETVKSPTDTEDGLEEQVCRRKGCGDKQTRAIPKLKVTADATQLRMLELVNEQRKKEGLSELFYYSAEQAAADLRIVEIMSSENNFSHTRPNGEKFHTALTGLGKDYFRCGENLAMGFDGTKGIEEVMKAWMESPGHRKNIMNKDFDALVVGYSKDGYWVQLFIGYV